jgi:2-polyprenyl-3-methyl-5-hydroxy-6-metoxy-1,4-benzoquinol methylase
LDKHEIAQNLEQHWWGDCINTLGEELKQLIYARYMGISFEERNGRPYVIDLKGKSVIDIGGGPVSLLLKTINSKDLAVVDPCSYPYWIYERYARAEIYWFRIPFEDFETNQKFDEAWIYNCLQHVKDPELVIKKAKQTANKIRIFEWINSEINDMHPHKLTESKLNEWLDFKGKIVELDGINGCVGRGYYGEV